MRVATYTQPAAVTHGSIAALSILVLTILLGTAVLPSLATHFAPAITPFLTYVWMGLYLLAFLGLMFGQGINWVSWLVRYRILLVVLLIGTVLSIFWSIDSRVSAERTVHVVGTSLIGIYLGFTIPLLTTLRVFAVVLAFILLASAAAALALPDLGIVEYEGQLVWRGLMGTKNNLGFWAGTGVLLYVTLSDSVRTTPLRLGCYLLAGFSLALLAFSHSATSLLAMLVAGALSLYLHIALRFQLGFVRMAIVAAMFTALVALAVVNIDTAELVGRTDDLTGRGEVWRQTWKLIMERPLGGYGYGALWFPNDATIWIQESLTDFTWVVYHAHNGFLQVASEVGLPLSIVALLMVAQQLIEIFYCQYQRQQPGVLFVLAFVVAYLISNFSEARFLVTRELYWVLFIALPISMLRQINLVFEGSGEEGPGDASADHGRGHGAPFASPARAPLRPPSQEPSTALTAGTAVMANVRRSEAGGGWSGEKFDFTADADIDVGEIIEPDAATGTAPSAGDPGPVFATRGPEGERTESAGAAAPDENDRYDKRFDATGDGTGDWLDLPYDGAGRGS